MAHAEGNTNCQPVLFILGTKLPDFSHTMEKGLDPLYFLITVEKCPAEGRIDLLGLAGLLRPDGVHCGRRCEEVPAHLSGSENRGLSTDRRGPSPPRLSLPVRYEVFPGEIPPPHTQLLVQDRKPKEEPRPNLVDHDILLAFLTGVWVRGNLHEQE